MIDDVPQLTNTRHGWNAVCVFKISMAFVGSDHFSRVRSGQGDPATHATIEAHICVFWGS